MAGRGECIFGTAKDSMQAATTTIEALKLSSATWVEALAAVHEELETEEMALATITESKMDYDDDDFDPNGYEVCFLAVHAVQAFRSHVCLTRLACMNQWPC